MTSLFRTPFILFVILFPVSLAAQSHLSPDPAVKAARVLVISDQFDAALRILRSLERGRPDETDVLFLTGMAAIGAAQAQEEENGEREALLEEAIAALRDILLDRPELVRVRLELARAFFLKRDDALAKRHFEQVLAGRPHPAVAANIERFLAAIRARRRWEARFGFALAPDSNLNTASENRTVWMDVYLPGSNTRTRLPFILGEETARESGVGVSIWGGGEYQYPLNERWRLRSGADASAREYKGSLFDSHFASAYLGPRWLIDARTQASLLATAQRQWSAGAPETDQFGLRLEGAHRLTPRLSVQGRLGARRRNCRDCNGLDGPVGEAVLGLNWVALPILRVGGNAGWNWSRANAEHWRSAGPEASLGATLALPAGFTVGARAAMRWTDYQGRGFRHRTRDREPREDRTRTLSLSVHNRAVTVLGFSPRVTLINETRETNAQALDYERNRGELSFVRLF